MTMTHIFVARHVAISRAGIEYYRIGKLLLWLEHDRASIAPLQRGVAALTRTHGRDHPLTKGIAALLDEAHAAVGQRRL